MKKYFILLIILLTASCSSLEKNRFEKANLYINSHPEMSMLNRMGILEGLVILGMNPCESIAAVGEPYSAQVEKDPALPPGITQSDIISKQCRNPDKSKIVFYFCNFFQYGKNENYAVTYIKGEAVRIERGAVFDKHSGNNDRLKAGFSEN